MAAHVGSEQAGFRGGPRPRALVLLGLVLGAGIVVVAVVAALASSAPRRTPSLPRSAIRVDVFDRPVSRAVAPGYVGLSIEYPSLLAYAGRDPRYPNPVFAALMAGLDPGQRPVIRVGGDTTDWTWWPPGGTGRPGGIHYVLSRLWLAMARATAQALNARLILGVNFEADSRRVAGIEARRLLGGVGRRYLAGFELGNEPEVYGVLPWFTRRSGRAQPVLGRRRSYGFAAYLRDYAHVAGALPVGVPLVGPASGAVPWLNGLSRYLRANPRVALATFHRYPLHRCDTPRDSRAYPTIANLLLGVASSGPALSLRGAVDQAHARGIPLRADELNSVSCGGARGVSNTFASALWVLDTLLNMVRVGVDGINLHTFQNAAYGPFRFRHRDHRWVARVAPIYYGLLAFVRAAPPGSRLLGEHWRGPGSLRIWTARGTRGRLRVVIINDSLNRGETVAVRLPAPATTGALQRLRAPSASARGGVTLGGQSFGPVTATGRLPGSPRSVTLDAVRGRFVVTVPAASAALLTVG